MPDPINLRTASASNLVIAGAACSGTSFLAAQLSSHPRIDPGSVKESNLFSRNYERGPAWYEGLFEPPADGLRRMDASVSYTFSHFPAAVDRLAAHAPAALVVYLVRDPIPRAVSHYLHNRHYFKQEMAPDFGAAIRTNELYAGASDYQRWLDALYGRFPRDQVLVVPFTAVTEGGVAAQVCARLRLPAPAPMQEATAEAHRNNVVGFKHEAFRVASRKLRRSRFYPVVRERLGADRLRRVRSMVTKETTLPTVQDALDSCSPDQLSDLHELDQQSWDAVTACLAEQDERLGLRWSSYWPARSSPTTGQ